MKLKKKRMYIEEGMEEEGSKVKVRQKRDFRGNNNNNKINIIVRNV